ncbi:MAG: hypothetical protein M3680_31125 [Myxococcota bacterium]|nr:hypothetical protein [Myxococcota bacterium]
MTTVPSAASAATRAHDGEDRELLRPSQGSTFLKPALEARVVAFRDPRRPSSPRTVAALAAAHLARHDTADEPLDEDRTIPRRLFAPETLDAEPANDHADDPYARTQQVPRLEPEPESYADYARIGLAPPRAAGGRIPKLIVASYRLLGFAILSLIVVVLVGYVATTTFYFFSTSWVTPVAVSASDEKVVKLKAELAAQHNVRDRLVAELDATERTITAQSEFQLAFAQAIRTDLEGRQAALGRVRELASTAARTRSQIRRSTAAYAMDHADKIAKEYDAGLIDRSAMLNGKYQLAQLSTSNLSLAERQADFEQRAAQLAGETRALDALLAEGATGRLSYEVLKIKRDYEESARALHKATADRQLLHTALGRQDEIIAGLQQAPYLRALAHGATVALVPYANLGEVTVGAPLHACRLEMVVCREVGRVLAILPGEVTFPHPHRDTMLRGQLVELRLTEPTAAAEDVLFAGGAPLLF